VVNFTYRHKTGKRRFSMEGPNEKDYIINYIDEKKSFYEIDLLEYMDFITRHEDRSGAVCIDVGANIGNHSVYMGAFIGKKVVSIEPNARLYKALYHNLENNGADYHVTECAVGEQKTEGRLVFPVDSEGSMGLARLESPEDSAPSENRLLKGDTVAVDTLDAVVSRHVDSDGRILLIKIDVEGNELSVLKGAAHTLEHHHPHLFVEVCRPELKNDLDRYLAERHYLPISRWAGTPVYHYVYRPTRGQRTRASLFRLKYVLITRHIKSIKRRLHWV